MNPETIRKDFKIFENRDIAYLDSGATSQRPYQVLKAVEEYYNKNNANPHRGTYDLSIDSTAEYDKARAKVAKFINAKRPEEIVFTKNATESLNLIANSYGLENLQEGDTVVISIMEHHSNLVPWQKVTKIKNAKLEYMYINENYEITDEEINKKITDKTKIVSITEISNVLGIKTPLEKIENELLEYAKSEMSKLDFVDIYAPKTNENQIGVLSFNIKDVHPHDTATILSSCGVCVRAGDHCAQPLIRFLNLPATCRASMYIYNTKADIDRLIMALNKANDMFKKWRKVKK